MDLNYLLNILLRRKWLLLAVMFVSSLATWFFIGRLHDTYKAESVISTGIIDYKGVSLQKENPFIQKFQIESSFSGLIEKMKSRNNIKILTEKLLAHDLLADGVKEKPFRIPDEEDLAISQNEIDNLVLKLKTSNTDSVKEMEPHSTKPDQSLAEAYGYDHESLMKKLEVNRIGETDYLSIKFKSEKPELSYFVVKTFVEQFFAQHEDDLSFDENETLEFNKNKLKERKRELDSIILKINDYKALHGLIDVSTQRESVIGQKKEMELRLEETNQSIPSLNQQIILLKNQIFKYNKVSGNAAYNEIQFNDEIVKLEEKIDQLQEQIIDNKIAGKKGNAALENQLETLKARRAAAIDGSFKVPQSEKDRIDDELKDLVKRRLDKELELKFATEAQRSYSQEIKRLEAKSNKLLINDNFLLNMEEEKDRLDKEYQLLRTEYEDAKYYAEGTESPLTMVEPVEMPVEPESKNRAVFSAFAGIAGGSLTSIFLFLLAFMDTSISMPSQFQRVTKLPLIGYVNKVKLKNQKLQNLFGRAQTKGDLEFFKENIRKIRMAIEISGAKSFLFVSPKEEEGKSFLLLLLAYALSLNNKKVLIIDTNFKNNTLSGFKEAPFFELTTAGKGLTNGQQMPTNGAAKFMDPKVKNIHIIGNKGGNQSPSEVLAGKNFKKIIDAYSKKFDFIFLEAAAMNKFSDARELLPYVEKLAVVFSSESPIGNADKDTLEYLTSMNGKMFGGILNKVDLKNI